MHSDDPEFTGPAFAVIRDNDPGTYARMVSSPWQVHVIETGEEQSIIDYAVSYGPQNVLVLLDSIPGAFGTTPQDHHGNGIHHTFLFKPAFTQDGFERPDSPPEEFLAAVLVHEFDHDNGGGESEAFDAGSAFAEAVKDCNLWRFSEDTRKEEIHAG